jgi:hypothetical protein
LNKLVRNEQRKLFATFLNGVAVAMFGVGGLAQLASMVQAEIVTLSLSIFLVICVALGVGLHLWGRWALRGLEE